MPGALIVANQPTGAGAGSPGVARNDLWLSQQIHLVVGTSGNSSVEWDLLYKPPGSAVTILNASQSGGGPYVDGLFTPDLVGTYRIQLVTNGGGPGNVQVKVLRVRRDAAGALSSRGWALPAKGELDGENNYGSNIDSWGEPFEYIIQDILTNVIIGAVGGDLSGTMPNPLVAGLTHVTSDLLFQQAADALIDARATFNLKIGTGATAALTIGKSSQALSMPGNVTIGGNLVVSGSSTTVNSTTVDVKDRVIHLNASTGIVGVPSLICGVSIDRGSSDGVTKRDMSSIVWEESVSRFRFANITAGDDATVGSNVDVYLANLSLSANIKADAATSTFQILHQARTSDASVGNLLIEASAPFASATGSNRNPGHIQLKVHSPAGAATSPGGVDIFNDAVNIFSISPVSIPASGDVRLSSSFNIYVQPGAQIFLDSETLNLRALGGAPIAVIDGTAWTTAWYGSTGAVVRTDTFSIGGFTEIYGATVASVSRSQVQSGAGAGGSWTIEAQQGRAGFVGGALILKTGKGGTVGTDLGGGITLNLGRKVANATSVLTVSADSDGTVATVKAAANFLQIATGAGAAAGTEFLNSVTATPWKFTDVALDLLEISFFSSTYCYINSPTYSTYIKSGGAILCESANTVTLRNSGNTAKFSVSSNTGVNISSNVTANQMQLSDVTWIEASLVAAGRRVVGLCVGADLNTTKMPTNSGSGVIFLGNAATSPTASPDTTGLILYSESGQLCSRDPGGFIDHVSIYDDSGPGGTLKRSFRHIGRATVASVSITTITTLKALFMTGTGAGVIFVRIFGFDTVKSAMYSGTRLIKFKSVAGTLTVTSTQTLGTDDGAPTYTVDVSTDIRIRVTDGDTDQVKWTAEVDCVYVEH